MLAASRPAVTERRALRVTPLARARLAPGRAGRITGVFARAVNLRLDAPGPAEWVSLHGPGPVPSPFGVACAALPAPAAWVGAPVAVEPHGEGIALAVGSAWRLVLAGAGAAETALPGAAPAAEAAALLAGASGRDEGLLPVVSGVLGHAARARPGRSGGRSGPPGACGSGLARVAGPRLRQLAHATAEGDAAGCLRAGARLLGLGPGLTPAGDDLLLGWIAGLHALGGAPGGRLVRGLAGPLAAAAAARTTALGRAFLEAALAGHVAEPVRAFVARPDGPRLAGLLALGATSGADVLAGYLLAAHALGTARGPSSLTRASAMQPRPRRGVDRPCYGRA